MANTYDKGDVIRYSVTFTVGGTDTDPTTVALKVKKPDGSSTDYTYALGTVTKDATGKYHKDLEADMEGLWEYRWTGTGTVQSVAEGWLEVRARRVA